MQKNFGFRCRFFCENLQQKKLPISVFTNDQNMLRDSVKKFAEEELAPLVKQMDEEEQLNPDILYQIFQQGFMGIEIPQNMGGCGMSFTDSLIVVEQIAKIDPAVAVIIDIHNTLVNRCFLVYGSEEQKSFYLPKCAQEIVGSFCLSETESGSDAFALKCKAKKDDVKNGWILNGTKQWISNAKEAQVFIVFATVDPAKKYKGITAFIVDKDSKGVNIGRKIDKLGIRASNTSEVIFENVFVPDNRILGNIGEGYKICIDSLNEGRIGIAAQMLGLAEGTYEYALNYLHTRKQFNECIGNFQGVKFQYAELATEIEACRLLTYNAAALRECGYPFTKEAAMAKFYSSNVAEKVASKCVEFLGGNGFSREFPVEKYFRDAKIGSIYEGTSNMQLETIAKYIQKELNF